MVKVPVRWRPQVNCSWQKSSTSILRSLTLIQIPQETRKYITAIATVKQNPSSPRIHIYEKSSAVRYNYPRNQNPHEESFWKSCGINGMLYMTIRAGICHASASPHIIERVWASFQGSLFFVENSSSSKVCISWKKEKKMSLDHFKAVINSWFHNTFVIV